MQDLSKTDRQWQEEIDSLKSQLATMTAERDELKEHNDDSPTYKEIAEVSNKTAAEWLAKYNDSQDQLAERGATIARLINDGAQLALGFKQIMDINTELQARVIELEAALTWVVNLHRGVSKNAGDGFHHGITDTEWADALTTAKVALRAKG